MKKMGAINPMTPEEYFAATAAAAKRRAKLYGSLNQLRIMPEDAANGGGWRVDGLIGCSYGDTIGEAIAAAADHALGKPSRRARLNRPYALGEPMRINYDYRAQDWRQP